MTPPKPSQPRLPARLIVLFAVLAIGILFAGFLYFSMQESRIEQARKDELASTAVFQASQISEWRRERVGDGRQIAGNTIVPRYVRSWLKTRAHTPIRDELQQWIRLFVQTSQYKGVILADSTGAVILTEGTAINTQAPDTERLVAATRTRRAITFSDIHSVDSAGHSQFELIIPIMSPAGPDGGAVIGVLMVLIDPTEFLFPFLDEWPSSDSSETVIVRRDADEVVYLTKLGRRQGEFRSLRQPLSRKSLPAVMAVLGREGIVEGEDLEGNRVLAALKPISDSPWYVVTKIPNAGLVSETAERGIYLALISLLLIGGAGMTVLAEWRRQRAEHLASLFEVQAERRAIAHRYEYLTRYANDIILLTDRDGRIIEANEKALDSYQYTLEEMLALNIRDLLGPGTERAGGGWADATRADGGAVFESEHRKRDGTPFPVEVSARTITLEGREYLQAIIRNIADRKRAEEVQLASLREKEILLKEIHHRVKNNLQVISSLLHLQADQIDDPRSKALLHESHLRVRSMGLVHERLYQSENLSRIDFGEYIRGVTSGLARSFNKVGIKYHLEVEDVRLGVDTAIPCGLIVNELVSNCIVHAFPGDRAGNVEISLKRKGPGFVELTVRDDGIGFPQGVDPKTMPSMGVNLILNLTDQIGGTLSMQRGEGTTFVVLFPVKEQTILPS